MRTVVVVLVPVRFQTGHAEVSTAQALTITMVRPLLAAVVVAETIVVANDEKPFQGGYIEPGHKLVVFENSRIVGDQWVSCHFSSLKTTDLCLFGVCLPMTCLSDR